MAFPNEKRSEERFPANMSSVCSFASPVVDDFGPVRIKNISLKGIGLITSKNVEVGQHMVLKIGNPSKNITKTVMFRVAHITPQAGGTFLIGGDFDTPLTYEEMCHFVM